jgi:hypothetical protein
MAAANGGADPDARPERRWDVALSFAGAQRDHVGQVAAALKVQGACRLYDPDEQVRMWGTHLAEELPRIYTHEVVVVFVSADYAAGDWTRLERHAAFSRAVAATRACVLPARSTTASYPGCCPMFADLVVARLADLAISPAPSSGGRRAGCRRRRPTRGRLGVHATSALRLSQHAFSPASKHSQHSRL